MQHETVMQRDQRVSPPRPLPIALAQVMANAKASDPRWPAMQRLFNALQPADKLACIHERMACGRAKRGELEAMVA